MKRVIIFMFVAVMVIGTVSAQNRNERQRASNSVAVEGTLKLERGLVAVESGETTYFVPLLTRYIGFIDGMKEGIKVSVEGFSFRNFINPTKVTIADKSYDFFANAPSFGARNENIRPERNNFMPDRRSAPGRNQRNDKNFEPNRRRNDRPDPNFGPARRQDGRGCNCSMS